MKLYLAGPMRGYPDNNSPAFREAAVQLRAAGHEVWSPAEHDEALGVDAANEDIRRTFRRDLDALLQCDGVVLLDGWSASHGACLERHTADVTGIPVYLVSKGNLIDLCSGIDWRWRAERKKNVTGTAS